MSWTRARLAELDAADPLAPFRARFRLPEGVVYLDGNSLGVLPRDTPAAVARVIEAEWGQGLITSWNRHDWIGLPQRVAIAIARIIGAAPHEVAVCDSVSVNLFKLLAAGLRLARGRPVILTERHTFPTDLYIAQGLRDLLGHSVELRLVDTPEELPAALGAEVGILMLTHVDYRTGRMHDMATLTAAAHAQGALALWDLAHSAGALPVDLTGAQADLAVGCGYKYLNGGPGAPAFLYVAERHQERVRQPLSGWMGHERPFAFVPDYEPAPGIDRFLAGTPAVIAMTALRVGAELMAEADMDRVRAKSLTMGEAMIAMVGAAPGFCCVSPVGAMRGSQVSFAHPEGYAIMQALIAKGVIGDFRAPDLLRFGFTPLYSRYTDVADAAEALSTIMAEGSWRRPEHQTRSRVT